MGATPAAQPEGPGTERASFVKRAGLAALITLVAVNVWTGSPLLALWIGSRIQKSSSSPSMAAVFLVLAVMVGLSLLLLKLLSMLGARYDQATGQVSTVRTPAPWLRSMRAERPSYERRRHLSGTERLVAAVVVAGVLAFEIWFFFFAGSSLPNS